MGYYYHVFLTKALSNREDTHLTDFRFPRYSTHTRLLHHWLICRLPRRKHQSVCSTLPAILKEKEHLFLRRSHSTSLP